MDLLTRRRFLVASGVAGAGALAAGAGLYQLRDIFDTAPGPDEPARTTPTLVLVTLYGGNDGLNTVVRYADDAYHSAREELAYPPERVLQLDEEIGLNPAMSGLARLYRDKRLAVVHGVGYPKPDRSHFRSMDIWQTASPVRPVRTGWLGRWLDATGADPRRAVSFEPALPVLLAGERTAGASVPVPLPSSTVASQPLPRGFSRTAPEDAPMAARVAQSYRDLIAVDRMLTGLPVPATATPAATGSATAGNATATGGSGALGTQLELVARCVEAGVATQVFSVSLGGFDTHADERSTQERLLGELDRTLVSFVDRMRHTAAGRRVVVAVYSEFGRRVRANASDGTDHGTASEVFLLGARVRGGRYGELPSLTDLDDGDLKFHTDFRDVYAMLLRRVLGTDPATVLDGWRGELTDVLR